MIQNEECVNVLPPFVAVAADLVFAFAISVCVSRGTGCGGQTEGYGPSDAGKNTFCLEYFK